MRESLGGALLRKGDAAGAEAVFRKDLEQNPRNARSLFGLRQALKRQSKDMLAAWIDQQWKDAWPDGAEPLSVDVL